MQSYIYGNNHLDCLQIATFFTLLLTLLLKGDILWLTADYVQYYSRAWAT